MQHETYGRVLRAGWEALEPYRNGDLLNRLNSDVNVVSDGTINFLPALITSLAKFIGAFAIMVYYDPVMAIIALLGVPVMLGLSRTLMRKMRCHNLEMKELTGEVMSFQEDSFRNLTSIKAFSLADRFENNMHRLQDTYTNAYLSYNAFQIFLLIPGWHGGYSFLLRLGRIPALERQHYLRFADFVSSVGNHLARLFFFPGFPCAAVNFPDYFRRTYHGSGASA